MKMLLRIFFVASLFVSGNIVNAQDTLPAFTVKHRSGKVILSWVNHFKVVKQISIQRSADSLKGFKTILTLPDPSSVTNGFLDNNAPDTVSFYKLYILLDSGKYVFSKSQKPKKDIPPPPQPAVKKETPAVELAVATPEKTAAAEQALSKIYGPETTKVSNKKMSDGLKADSVNMVRPENVTPSGFIFTNPQGNVTVILPKGKTELFTIKFFDSNGDELFQLNNLKEHTIVVDKSNFMRAGIYRFELYENNVLREKNKVTIPKDPAIR
ncbi:MAG: hypothetical protein BGP13_19425 [Sphingobacteriales bacterium 40-81]|nr:MAG: hypothetical protein BGP13_19425 [Sphingobacteriales bacterium 40-81]